MTARNLTIDLRFGRREVHVDRTSRVLAPLIMGVFAVLAAIISICAALLGAVVLTVNLLRTTVVALVARARGGR